MTQRFPARYVLLALFLAAAATTGSLCHARDWWTLWAVWTAVAFVFLYPTLRPNTAWMGPVVTRFRTDRREVWLTIDDGPDPEQTPQILALLARHGAKATFFVIGERAHRHPELVEAIVRAGHTVGNHTFSHPAKSWWIVQPTRVAREIDSCTVALGQHSSGLFRAPVGMANSFVFSALRRRGMELIGWSARGFDAIEADPEKVVGRIWKGIAPGAIVLLHEGYPGNPEGLALLLDRLAVEGYGCIVPEREQYVG